MSIKKPSIPMAPYDSTRKQFDSSIKECLETIMGRRAGSINPLTANASMSDVIDKVNEIIGRLQ